jgi:hypothetical protein
METAARRFDLGMRDATGNHGFIAIYDEPLERGEQSEMLRWSDSTRAPFSQHWFWVPISKVNRALIRVSPQSGGLRGMASTTQALVVPENAIAMAMDLSPLITLFPPAPIEIGQPATWSADSSVSCGLISPDDQTVNYANLDLLFNQPGPLDVSRNLSSSGICRPEIEAIQMLRLYAMCPDVVRKHVNPSFATSQAPAGNKPCYVFSAQPPMLQLGPRCLAWRIACAHLERQVLWRLDPSQPNVVAVSLMAAALNVDQDDPLSNAQVGDLFALLKKMAQIDFGERLLTVLERCIGQLKPRAQVDRLLAIQADPAGCEEAGIPPVWAQRLLAAPNTFPSIPAPVFEQLGQAMLRNFPDLLLESVALWSRECVRQTLEIFDVALMIGGDTWVQARHAGIFGATLSRILLEDAQGLTPRERSAIRLAACRVMLNCEARASELDPAVTEVNLQIHESLAKTSRRYAEVIVDVSQNASIWLGMLEKPCGSPTERALHFQNISRALAILWANDNYRKAFFLAAVRVQAQLEQASAHRTWLAMLQRVFSAGKLTEVSQ